MGRRMRGAIFTWYGSEIWSPPKSRPYQVNATATLFSLSRFDGGAPRPKLRPYQVSGATRTFPIAYSVFTYCRVVYLLGFFVAFGAMIPIRGNWG